ncbi:MAG: hypothetical protein K0B08_01245 [Bacteroidales bacterium]|nr:hypothetical protein [Bacteroidales bacterium]
MAVIIFLPMILALTFVPVRLSNSTPGGGSLQPLFIAHRGASGTAPENTLPAIDSALAAGVDYVEIDVHLSRDGKVIVIHDATVDRTTNGKGKVRELSAEYIQSLDAGSWFGEPFRGVKIPTLEEVIRHIDGKAKLLIEIKRKGKENEGIEAEVVRLIRKYEAADWCVVQAFNDKVLETMYELAPEIVLHKLIVFKYRFIPYVFDGRMTRFSMNKYAYVESINMHYRFFNMWFSDQVHREGKKIFLWGCRKETPCIPLDSEGWDGWITDFP